MSEDENENNKVSNNDIWFLIGAVFCSAVALFIFFKINYSIENGGQSLRDNLEMGYFIISIVAPSALFFIALRGLASIKIAFEQLETQKTQFQEQIKLQKESSDAQTKQFQEQNIENNIFKLIDLQNNIVKSLNYTQTKPKEIKVFGKDVISYIKNKIADSFNNELNHIKFYREEHEKIKDSNYIIKSECGFTYESKKNLTDNEIEKNIFYFVFKKIFEDFDPEIDHYIANLQYLILSIDSYTIIDEKKKQNYFNLLKVQLSPNEKTFFLYYTFYYNKGVYIGHKDGTEFINILEKYKFFDRIDIYNSIMSILFEFKHVRDQYNGIPQ